MSLYQYRHPHAPSNTTDAILSCVTPPLAKLCAGTIITSSPPTLPADGNDNG